MVKKQNDNRVPLTDEEKKQVKRDNFARVLPVRMDKATKAIRQVGECSSVNYLYTKEYAKYIVAQLRAAVDSVEKRYSGEAGKTTTFQLPE